MTGVPFDAGFLLVMFGVLAGLVLGIVLPAAGRWWARRFDVRPVAASKPAAPAVTVTVRAEGELVPLFTDRLRRATDPIGRGTGTDAA